MILASDEAVRTRDAATTRRQLLQAARRRFAYDGYSATTVRDIAADVGVNVALINRYFTSKEGLFEACLTRTAEELDRLSEEKSSLELTIETLVRRVSETSTREHHPELLLLLRSSGDERADEIRRRTLLSFTERLAAVAGYEPEDPATAHLLLRAQVALSTVFGITMLRSSSAGVEPLASAGETDLAGPLGDVLRALLGPA